MNSQLKAILQRLKKGRASNVELTEIAGCKNFTARISDLRNIGHNIKCVAVDKGSGVSWYRLDKDNPLEPSDNFRTAVSCTSRLCKHNKRGRCKNRQIRVTMANGRPICWDYRATVRGRKHGNI